MIRRVPALFLAGSLTVMACGGSTASAPPSAAPSDTAPSASAAGPTEAPGSALDALCARAAAEEGQVVYWHTMADETIDALVDMFSARYPGIDVESLSVRPDDAVQRVLTEAAAGRQITPDVVDGELDIYGPLLERDLIDTSEDWVALGVAEDKLNSLNMVRLDRVTGGIVYNTNVYTADELPDTWEGLIDPKFRGRVVVDPRGRPYDQLALEWGRDEALDHVRRLKDVVAPLVIQGGTAGMVAVAGGEADITTGGRSAETREQQAAGAPLEIKYLDVITTLDSSSALIGTARHPLSARCWTAWSATEGEEERLRLEFKENATIPSGAPADAVRVTIDTLEKAEIVDEVSTEMGRIWSESQ